MSKVCIVKKECYQYPIPPFRPACQYPEYPFEEISSQNDVYDQVRECFHLMGLDEEHFGTKLWNPLRGYIHSGDTVLLKPNMVMDHNALPENGTDCLFTHPSVVSCVADYVAIALAGTGKIVIGDAPMQECDFQRLTEFSGYKDLVSFYQSKGLAIELVDFRELTSKVVNGLREQTMNENSHGKIVDLGIDSEFADCINYDNLRITNYNPKELLRHHSATKNEYFVSDYLLEADVVINIPKPKSHRKAGATIAMKNLVGINVRKEYLPHHTLLSIAEGGDEYLQKDSMHALVSRLIDKRNAAMGSHRMKTAQLYRALGKMIKVVRPYQDYAEGSWYGNHTISKTICDLNKIVLYADKSGVMQDKLQRRIFIVADMIISGEKEGPVAPSPKEVGIIAMGDNQVVFDEAIASLMGFDKVKLPFLVNARNVKGKYKLCESNETADLVTNTDVFNRYHFEPTKGWKGHIELAGVKKQ